jgi:hypothetical protein
MARQVAALRYISQFQAKQSLVLFLNSVCLAEMQQINFLLSLDWPDWAWSHKLAHYTTIIYPNNGNIRNIHNIKQFHHTCFSQSMKRKSFKMFLITQVTFLQSLVLIGMVGLWEKDSLVEFLSWSGLKVNVSIVTMCLSIVVICICWLFTFQTKLNEIYSFIHLHIHLNRLKNVTYDNKHDFFF